METKDISSKENHTTVQVEEYVYERIKKRDSVINVPQEPIYYMEYNHRIITGIFPKFIENYIPNLYRLDIVRITSNNILKTCIYTNPKQLSDILLKINVERKSNEDNLKYEVVTYLKNYYTDNRVTKKEFLAKYNTFLQEISELKIK